jgi:hypothetical protein
MTFLNYLTNYVLAMCMYVNSTEPSKIGGLNFEQMYTILPSVQECLYIPSHTPLSHTEVKY